jgi:hypothetical protein
MKNATHGKYAPMENDPHEKRPHDKRPSWKTAP